MFKILGPKEIIKNIITLCNADLSNQSTVTNLKNNYRSFLTKIQPKIPRNPKQTIQFLHKPQDTKIFLQVFDEKSVLDDFEQIFDYSDLSEQEILMTRVSKSLERLKEINSNFYETTKLVIETIFSASSKLAGGGSTSAAIGCIWINLRKHWQEQDVLEFLVHETTHNLVFIDELCFGHYTDYAQLVKEENFSLSAILNRPRPLDKVFHSIIVSTEVLLFRNQHFGHPSAPCLHPPTKIMLEQAVRSIEFLKQTSHLQPLLSQRAWSLLNLCEENLKTLSSDMELSYAI